MLDEDAVLQDPDLGAFAVLAHHHDPLDALPPGEELGLGDDGAAPAGLAALAAALSLGFQAGAALDPGGHVAVSTGFPDPGHGAGRVVALRGAAAAAATAGPAASARRVLVVRAVALPVLGGIRGVAGRVARVGRGRAAGLGGVLGTGPAPTLAATATTAPAPVAVVVFGALVRVPAGVRVPGGVAGVLAGSVVGAVGAGETDGLRLGIGVR